ncbi:MAG: hypothetical protein HQL61_09200 [Magnetococcales bacterium]|uniref:Uncharacterized protein n=1 Tax=Candidatus Magnetobacterium casense TaxID=1455061 RepID=A0ABS6RZW1_9BACT|nr:hypothetical protein [Candidatus Magnetobacterium casensis]MBF0607708.1 hypothetical protein [Nitrospirota bacterium]MBV6342165.1 hypothetical protein [Candidatus Magnetobacterium casensis]
MKHLRLPLIVSLTLLSLYACAWLPKFKDTTAVDHRPHDITLNELLKRLDSVTRILGTVELSLKTSKQTLSGNASIVLDDSGFQINVYSLGFLVGEFTQKDGRLSSSPEMDDADKEVFARVIREGLLWWKFDDLVVSDLDDWLILKTYGRVVVLSKATLSPVKQSLYIGDGSIMRIVYKDTVWTDGIAYPSRIDASLGENSISIKVEAVRFERGEEKEGGGSAPPQTPLQGVTDPLTP